MKVNQDAVNKAKTLIKDGKYTVDTDWSERQPSADRENRYLKDHNWRAYGEWYLGIDADENEETKARFNFPYGDFARVHRAGVIAAKQRAGQYDYAEIEKAADELLELIDKRENNK